MSANARSSLVTRLRRKSKESPRSFLLAVLVLLGGMITVYFYIFPGNGVLTSTAGVLVLEDCDSDFRTPPFTDAVILFGPDGKPAPRVKGLNICETVGGCRSLSVSRDGRFLTVCENVAGKLTAYETASGKQLWSQTGGFDAATVAPNGMVFALTSAGTIYGKDTLVLDPEGRMVRQAPLGGFDLAVDADRNALWLVGKTVKKCDLDLKVLLEISPIGWCAVSVDVERDGSVWVAERHHPDVAASTNRLFKLSPEGKVLKSVGLNFDPICLRVDQSDGSVWVTGITIQVSATKRFLESIEKRTGQLPIGNRLRDYLTRPTVSSTTRKYDQEGRLQREIKQGGFSLDIDSTDGSVWIGGYERVYRYSRQGKALGRSTAGPPNQKYVAVVPGNTTANR